MSQTIASQQFRKIEFAAPTEVPSLPIQVELTDGSLVRCQQFSVSESNANLLMHHGVSLNVPTKSIYRVLLQPLTTDDDRTLWEELSKEQLGKDILVFRRSETTVYEY